jgi:hypothetical protein
MRRVAKRYIQGDLVEQAENNKRELAPHHRPSQKRGLLTRTIGRYPGWTKTAPQKGSLGIRKRRRQHIDDSAHGVKMKEIGGSDEVARDIALTGLEGPQGLEVGRRDITTHAPGLS